MSTRATYCFHDLATRDETFVYIHHDGYFEGAATKFADSILKNKDNQDGKSPLDHFLDREDAEVTHSHECHSDSQYRYNLYYAGTEVCYISAWRRVGFTDQWVCDFGGPLDDFCSLTFLSLIVD